MATTIQIKRSTGTSAPGTLANGELAVTFGTGTASNLGDRLFIGDGSSVNVIGGKFFSDMLDHTQGTLTASSALTVDSNKALDDLIVGNHATTGGSIELKEGTNNGTHHVQLKAPNRRSSKNKRFWNIIFWNTCAWRFDWKSCTISVRNRWWN